MKSLPDPLIATATTLHSEIQSVLGCISHKSNVRMVCIPSAILQSHRPAPNHNGIWVLTAGRPCCICMSRGTSKPTRWLCRSDLHIPSYPVSIPSSKASHATYIIRIRCIVFCTLFITSSPQVLYNTAVLVRRFYLRNWVGPTGKGLTGTSRPGKIHPSTVIYASSLPIRHGDGLADCTLVYSPNDRRPLSGGLCGKKRPPITD
ncbi:hypothetical protein GGR54DRAFT_541528 [Hypoxylon sp. NC1633]|nr:hypothetical protein GGR54DRAFT_541528 [Hypoxylon sp. NC1633]